MVVVEDVGAGEVVLVVVEAGEGELQRRLVEERRPESRSSFRQHSESRLSRDTTMWVLSNPSASRSCAKRLVHGEV
jgi:hypothetical protein